MGVRILQLSRAIWRNAVSQSSNNRTQGIGAEKSTFVVSLRVALGRAGIPSPIPPTELRLTGDQLKSVMKSLLRGVSVDEVWYRRVYPDVDQAIRDGGYKSAKHHFVEDGYFEGRRPGIAVVDENWYLSVYQDVAEGVETGEITSCQDHFESHGEAEGRLPREY
jgi:hypothetical protein